MVVRIYGNRAIKTLSGQQTRPTASKVREALFNIWQGRIDGCRWLDLCAGSGAMGAEALCRNAASVTGIEKLPKACGVIQDNWQCIAREQQSIRIIRGDVLQKLRLLSKQSFDHIYFDPPYASELYLPVLESVVKIGLLSDAGELAVEHDRGQSLPNEIPSTVQISQVDPQPEAGLPIKTIESRLICCRIKHYGRTSLTFYRNDDTLSRA